jgi:hypothetical protein
MQMKQVKILESLDTQLVLLSTLIHKQIVAKRQITKPSQEKATYDT